VDVLADSVAGEDPLMDEWGPFWEIDVSRGDALLRQAVLSRLITARHAARLMIRQRRGLIVEVTEHDLLGASGNVLTQLARMSHKLLVTVLALELRPHDVAAVALTPGFLRSERVLEYFGVTEASWREAGSKDSNFLESESPLFVGRAVAALAQAPDLVARSGHLFSTWGLARELGFTDADGRRPDWGALTPDFSTVPAPICRLLLDGLEFQRDWLSVLSDRTARYLDTWGPGLLERSRQD
jgi:NAD(P)-dependent dehydrogenase (short-subunit alcohol dehydrogenase family)